MSKPGPTKAAIIGGAFAAVLVLLALVAGYRSLEDDADSTAAPLPAIAPSAPPAPMETHPAAETHEGFLYGRVTTTGDATFEGRLRFGGDEEAFWGDYFNGSRIENSWADLVPPERLEESRPIAILGVVIANRKRRIDVDRYFMARLGDIARIEAHGRRVRVTLKNGAEVDVDRHGASDFDDGMRVWDGTQGVVDLDSRQIRSIELLPTPTLGAAPYRLHGTVTTPQGAFTGFVQWDRQEGVGSDLLHGHTEESPLSVRFDTIRSIERRWQDGVRVTLLDGYQIVLSGSRKVSDRNRGLYVDDPRYGRVLISWEAFERIDFSPGGGGPAYGDFPPGRPLEGSVTTRSGERLSGRLVYDLDESETVETFDAPIGGVDYTIPFGLIASIVPHGGEKEAGLARVTLHSGEELRLERKGDLGERNGGMLIFVDGGSNPVHVPWRDVEQIDLDRL